MAELTPITVDLFDEQVLASPVPVIVDFWHELCRPCMALKPILSEVEGDYGDRLAIVTAHAGEARPLHERFGVRSIPTLILFKEGKEVGRTSGLQSKSQLMELIDKVI